MGTEGPPPGKTLYQKFDIIDERYEIVRFVGDGATSDVYEARNVRDGRYVALKILNATRLRDPVARERFHREASVQAMIRHKNVAALYGNGVTAAAEPYLALELFGDRCLRTELIERKRLTVAQACTFVLEALNGLAACHAVGVRHRDLKPENMMLRKGDDGVEHVALIDFGFASFEGESRLTSEGFVVGSMSYLAPERLLGNEGDARADIYAMGVVLFELLVGAKPFQGEGASLAHSHLDLTPPAPSSVAPDAGIPAGLDEVVLTALAKEPGARYQSADAMAQAVDRILHPTRNTVPPEETSSYPPEATVLCWDMDGVERTYELADAPLQIGRAPECAIRSADPLVSRYHARLWRGDDGQYWIEDLGSTNGVWVGGELTKKSPVPTDEIVLVGSLVLQVRPNTGSEAAALRAGIHTRLWMWLRAERASRAAVEDERNALGHRLGELHQALQQLHAGEDTTTPHAVSQELQLLRDDAREMSESLAASEAEKIELSAKLAEVQRQLSSVLQKKMAESFAAQSENAKLAETITDNEIRIGDLEGKLHARDEELRGLRADLQQLSAVAVASGGAETLALVAAQADKARLAERVTQLEDTAAELQRDIDDRDKEIDELREDLRDASDPTKGNEVAALNDQLAAFARELEQLRSSQHQSHSTAARLRVQLDMALAEVGELRSQGQNTADFSASSLSRVELEKAMLSEQVASLESEIHNLRSGGKAAEEELVSLRERLVATRAEAEAAWAEVDELRKLTGGN